MDTVARRPATLWTSRATAPLRLIGRRPGASAAVAGLLLLAGGWVWWMTQLWGLPDIGDPFDVAAFQAVRVPDDRNAFVEYREAAATIAGKFRALAISWNSTQTAEWSKVDNPWRDLVDSSRPTLDLWRSGAEKPDFLYIHAKPLSMLSRLPVTQELRFLGWLAVLEGSRLEDVGDMAAAWGWYRAALRSSRHTGRHGFQLERLVGAAIHDDASKALTRWAADPRVDAAMLRRALSEVIAIDALTAPRSDSVKMHYLTLAGEMDDPGLIDDVLLSSKAYGEPGDWCEQLPIPDRAKVPIQAARVIAADDRERSLRVARLMTANWLAQVDKPPARRAPMVHSEPPVYGDDPASPGVLRPEKLAGWLDSSLIAGRFFRGLEKFGVDIDRERPRQARLVVHLADQLYRREHGAPPPSPAALVGPYLKALPEGYDERP